MLVDPLVHMLSRKFLTACLVVSLPGIFPVGASPQQPAPEESAKPATIVGRVVDAANGAPLSKARLILRPIPGRRGARVTSAQPDGQFVLSGIRPGRYRLRAERNGYAPQEWGQRSPAAFGIDLTLRPGQVLDDILFRLVPGAVIAGRIVDEDGEPNAGVGVSALQILYRRGRPYLRAASNDLTDDLGQYRIYGLPAGRYYLSARFSWRVDAPGDLARAGRSAGAGPEESYLPTLYPGVHEVRQAIPIEVSPGAETRSADFPLRVARTVRVRGRVINEHGGQGRSTARLVPRDPLSVWSARSGGRSRDGRFEFQGVAPGSYTLFVQVMSRAGRYSARMELEVGDRDLNDVVVTVVPDLTLDGRVGLSGDVEIDLTQIRVFVEPLDSGSGRRGAAGQVREDGGFRLERVAPDRYRVGLRGLPEDFYLDSAAFGSADVLEAGLDLSQSSSSPGNLVLRLNPLGAQAGGVVMDAEQQPVAGAQVVLVPEARRRHRLDLFHDIVSDSNGIFLLRGIPPGRYKLFAWDTPDESPWQDPAFLQRFQERGVSCDLDEGEVRSFDLEVITAK